VATAKSCEDNERSSIGPTIGYLVELEVVLLEASHENLGS
jgi:hypothetical protein